MRKSPIDNFEEARRCLKNLFTNISPQKDRPSIVETRTKGLEEEVSYKELVQDLYFSHLEDDPRENKRSYQEQLEEFQEWYKKLPEGTDKYLVERMILRPGYSCLSESESRELRNKYFLKPVKISVVRMDSLEKGNRNPDPESEDSE